MVMFHSYVKFPEGNPWFGCSATWICRHGKWLSNSMWSLAEIWAISYYPRILRLSPKYPTADLTLVFSWCFKSLEYSKNIRWSYHLDSCVFIYHYIKIFFDILSDLYSTPVVPPLDQVVRYQGHEIFGDRCQQHHVKISIWAVKWWAKFWGQNHVESHVSGHFRNRLIGGTYHI
jgi:hypothetical protein